MGTYQLLLLLPMLGSNISDPVPTLPTGVLPTTLAVTNPLTRISGDTTSFFSLAPTSPDTDAGTDANTDADTDADTDEDIDGDDIEFGMVVEGVLDLAP